MATNKSEKVISQKDRQKRKKLLLTIIGIIVTIILLGGSAVAILNYEGGSGEAGGSANSENTGNGGGNSGSNGTDGSGSGSGSGGSNGLSDPSAGSGSGGSLSYRSPINITPEDEVYLDFTPAELEEGLAAFEEDYESSYTVPEGSVGDYTAPNASTDLEGTGNTYTPGETISADDVSPAEANVRYYIEQRQRDTEDVGSASLFFPSRDAGYTNNPDNYELEDGSFNPLYSYVLAEDVQYFYGHHLQRLLNPVYGNWWQAQLGSDSPNRFAEGVYELEDMFSSEWWEENVVNGNPSNLPIMADFNGDNFGGMDLAVGPRWFGEITGHEISVNSGDRITSVIEVKFTSFPEDPAQKPAVRSGVLTLTVEPNLNSEAVNNRLVISEADLKLN